MGPGENRKRGLSLGWILSHPEGDTQREARVDDETCGREGPEGREGSDRVAGDARSGYLHGSWGTYGSTGRLALRWPTYEPQGPHCCCRDDDNTP